MRKTNIVLIGMPGAGKSTVGVVLAKNLGMAFIDSDLLIQEAEGGLLQAIIENMGRDEFLRIEEQTILKISAPNTVIATGGSVIYSDRAIRHLKANGTLVFLKLPYPELEKRIKNMSSRGIVIEKGNTLIHLFEERAPLYEKYADVTVDCSNTSIEEAVHVIMGKINN